MVSVCFHWHRLFRMGKLATIAISAFAFPWKAGVLLLTCGSRVSKRVWNPYEYVAGFCKPLTPMTDPGHNKHVQNNRTTNLGKLECSHQPRSIYLAMHLKLLANPLECFRLGNLPGSLVFIIFHQVRPAPEYDGDTTQLVVLLHRQGIDSMLPIDVDPDANWKPGFIRHTGEHIKTRNWLFQFVASRSSRPLLTYLRVCVCVSSLSRLSS